jgi:hypothetical protein
MGLPNEIQKAVMHINANAPAGKNIDDEKVKQYAQQAIDDLKQGECGFKTYTSIVLKQGSKKRYIKRYELFSSANILCQYIKQILDKCFKIKYPNRNKIVHTLFDLLKAVKQMSDFTIIKFDFEDYFNSVSSMYVFKKYIHKQMSDRKVARVIDMFVSQTEYAHVGLCTSNIFSEIIAGKFDESIRQAFSQHGLIFFERYVDDTIIILNQHMEKNICTKIMEDSLKEVYYDQSIDTKSPCKTKFNDSKFRMITNRSLSKTPMSVDFLGYKFFLKKDEQNKSKIQYGITTEKRHKYNARLDKTLIAYKEINDMELLRHRIAGFTSRTVYMSKKSNKNIWRAKGFINNYGELRFLVKTSLLRPDTKKFLANMVEDAFSRNGMALPYFLKEAKTRNSYNLLNNMETNKTLLLVEHVGYDKAGLEKLCKQIGINTIRKGYGNLVREYLIKIKVGY